MHLAQDNYVVHTLTPDRSDQPFGKAILPGRPDPHGAQSARDDAAIGPVAIADEVARSPSGQINQLRRSLCSRGRALNQFQFDPNIPSSDGL
jgi:hypothetical protein